MNTFTKYKRENSRGLKIISPSIIIISLIIFASPWATYTQFALATTPVTVLSGGLFIYCCGRIILRSKRFPIYKEDIFIVLFLTIVCLSYFVSLYPAAWALDVFWYVVCVFIYFSTKAFITDKSYLKVLAFSAIMGIIVTQLLLTPSVDDFGISSGRSSVPFHNSNYTAYCLCALSFLILINLTLNKSTWRYKFVHHMANLLSVYCVIELGTRGAIISLFLMYAFYFLVRFIDITIYRVSTVIFVAVSLLTAAGVFEALFSRLDMLSTRGDGELGGRAPSWEFARTLFLDHPFLGIGAGAFQFVNPLHIGAHNATLDMAMDTGILGVSVFFVWLAANFAQIKLGDPRKSQLAVLWMAYALPISLSGEWILGPVVWITFGIVFGLKDAGIGCGNGHEYVA